MEEARVVDLRTALLDIRQPWSLRLSATDRQRGKACIWGISYHPGRRLVWDLRVGQARQDALVRLARTWTQRLGEANRTKYRVLVRIRRHN